MQSIQLQNLSDLYPIESELRIESLAIEDDEFVVRLATDCPDVIKSPQAIKIKIQDMPVDSFIKRRRAETKEGLLWRRERYITIHKTSLEHYKNHNSSSPGWITIEDTNMPFTRPNALKVMNWLPMIYEKDKKEVRELFPDLENLNAFETARKIILKLTERMEEHKGTPSNDMNRATPLDQYRMAIRGESWVQCNNIVEMFVSFCRTFGIPARRINLWQGGLLDPQTAQQKGYNIQTAAGHTVTEIYDPSCERWIFMDPMYSIYCAQIGERCYLSLAELQIFINNPGLEAMINIGHFKKTPDGFRPFDNRFNDWEPHKIYKNYLNQTQKISYVMP